MCDRERSDRLPGRLNGLRPSGPPAELRSRTIAAAASVLADEAEVDVWTRLWSSRPLRMAWAVVVSLLVLAHVAVTLRSLPPAGVDRLQVAVSGDRLAGELAEIADLPPIEPSALARLP